LNKTAAYAECYDAIVAVWTDEGGATLDDIALMATINSILANRFPHFFWTGFYRMCGDRHADRLDAFDEEDRVGLERIVALFATG
jgi:putative methionine-R-sulfoxide reductase with GAF domain